MAKTIDVKRSAEDVERDKRQREYLKKIGAVRKRLTALDKHVRSELDGLANDVAVLEEVAASGQSHAAAVYLEVQQLWTIRTGRPYEGIAAADLAALRTLITRHGAAVVRTRYRRFLEGEARWTNAYSLQVFKKRFAELGAETSSESWIDDRLGLSGSSS